MFSGVIEPIGVDVHVMIDTDLSPSARSAALADVARQSLSEAQEDNRSALGFVPAHEVMVDGVVGANEDRVRPDGTIDYTFHLPTEIFGWILAMLQQFAPVLSGAFKASFELYADGRAVDPAQPPRASEYVFISGATYAAEIEGGLAKAPESRQAPNGVFEAVAVLAQQRFGSQASISFAYRQPFADEVLVGNPGHKPLMRTPVIVVSLGDFG